MSKKMEFKDIEFEEVFPGFVGYRDYMPQQRARLFFDNGYGISILSESEMSVVYSDGKDEDLYEIAVLMGSPETSEVDYDTPITDDVLRGLTEQGVLDIIEKIKLLKQGDDRS